MSTTHDDTVEVRTDVSWNDYVRLRDSRESSGLRMTYHDGTLIVKSPEYIHEGGAEVLGMIVREVALAIDVEFASSGSTTFHREVDGSEKGNAKEPDASFYLGESVARIWGKTTINLAIDPPPDLAIEVENKADSDYALAVYSVLRVPEVWRYDAREATLWFGRLVNGSYERIDRSIGLPVLTPDLVLGAMRAYELGRNENSWVRWLRAWAVDLAEGRIS